ncbi:MAG: glycosyltransferase family 2 protein [Draconibacterium sp.]
MKISLITATYNSERNLQDCLRSVAAQDYPDIEHILIDGGSTDHTMKIVGDHPKVSKVLSEPDLGIYDAFNKGIKMATGEVIGFVHSDDILAGTTVLSTVAGAFAPAGAAPADNIHLGTAAQGKGQRAMRHNGGNRGNKHKVSGVYGNLIYVDAQNTDKVLRTWVSRPFKRKRVKNGWMPPHPALFLRREVYEKYGLFDPSFRIAGDYDFMLRIMLDPRTNLKKLPLTIVKMRKGGASTRNGQAILQKMKEDIVALKKNGIAAPFWALMGKNLRKLPQLLLR